MSTSPDGIYERGIIDPGLPVKSPTQPFWLSEPSTISKLQSSPWPETADIVIIGSGMTAVSLAYKLLTHQPATKIVIVEARDLCSGATGRNGGHIKVMSPGVWYDRVEEYGLQEAIRVMEYEHSHLREMVDCIQRNGIECDLRQLEGLDVYHDKRIFNRAVRAIEDMRKHVPALAARYTVYTTDEQLTSLNLNTHAGEKHCVGAIGMPSGSMWPYKMVTGLFEKMVNERGKNLSIQTNTVVTSIQDQADEEFATVRTTRGDIRAKHVVHATNAWLGHLLHELRPFVSPVRANVQRQVVKHSDSNPFRVDRTYWLRYAEKDYDYMMQRPDGAFIIGRANTGRRATSDDGTKDLLPHVHLRGGTPQVFNFKNGGLQNDQEWRSPE